MKSRPSPNKYLPLELCTEPGPPREGTALGQSCHDAGVDSGKWARNGPPSLVGKGPAQASPGCARKLGAGGSLKRRQGLVSPVVSTVDTRAWLGPAQPLPPFCLLGGAGIFSSPVQAKEQFTKMEACLGGRVIHLSNLILLE